MVMVEAWEGEFEKGEITKTEYKQVTVSWRSYIVVLVFHLGRLQHARNSHSLLKFILGFHPLLCFLFFQE